MTESRTQAFLRREQERKLRELQPMLERLSQTDGLLQDMPYAPASARIGERVGLGVRLPELPRLPPLPVPPAFVDPLEQLDLGRPR